MADPTEFEMALMDRYPDAYGYEFYVLRRPPANGCAGGLSQPPHPPQ